MKSLTTIPLNYGNLSVAGRHLRLVTWEASNVAAHYYAGWLWAHASVIVAVDDPEREKTPNKKLSLFFRAAQRAGWTFASAIENNH